MSKFIRGRNVSHAWCCAVKYLLSQPGYRASHLVVSVTDPTLETDGVRTLLDSMFGDGEDDGTSTVERVADTIFPLDLWDPNEEESVKMLFDRRKEAREFGKELVPNGGYFDWFCEYPHGAEDPFNQLEHVVKRLQSERESGYNNANATEMGLPASWDIRVQTPGKHTSIMGFPCLSHVSVSVAGGRIDLAATYRAQDFVDKAYGNLLGLGRLTEFLAKESGYAVGEVLCVATGAIMRFKDVHLSTVRNTVSEVSKLVGDCGADA